VSSSSLRASVVKKADFEVDVAPPLNDSDIILL
jgi:hypothetical protein